MYIFKQANIELFQALEIIKILYRIIHRFLAFYHGNFWLSELIKYLLLVYINTHHSSSHSLKLYLFIFTSYSPSFVCPFSLSLYQSISSIYLSLSFILFFSLFILYLTCIHMYQVAHNPCPISRLTFNASKYGT